MCIFHLGGRDRMMKELVTGILLVLILACAILVSKRKHCDKGIVAESLIGYKCGHVVIHSDSEFTFVVFLYKHLARFVLFKALNRKAADAAGEQLYWYELHSSHVINSATCFGTPHVPSLGNLRSSYYNAFKLSVV
jgi:hypothetical protein